MQESTLDQCVELVERFNIDIGVNRLGGIFGVFEIFSDDSLLASQFDDLLEHYKRIAILADEDKDKYDIQYSILKGKTKSKYGEKKADILFCYLGFFSQVVYHLERCPAFAKWICDSDYTMEPHIFTKLIMLKAIKFCINQRGDSSVSSSVLSSRKAKDAIRKSDDPARNWGATLILLVAFAAFLSLLYFFGRH